VTGWGQEDDRRKSTAAGFDGHLVKPVNPETLEEELSMHLHRVSRRCAYDKPLVRQSRGIAVEHRSAD
jgi:DNA-binding response OmpR family regulator